MLSLIKWILEHTYHMQKFYPNIQYAFRKIPLQKYSLWLKDVPRCFPNKDGPDSTNKDGPDSREMSQCSVYPQQISICSHNKEHNANLLHLLQVVSNNGLILIAEIIK